MSNHLHDLLDGLRSDKPVFFDHMTEAQMDHVHSMALRAAERAMCFFAGDLDDLSVFKVVDDLVRLPFSVCWVEMKHETADGFFLFGHLMWEHDGKINSQAWRKHKGEWCYLFSWVRSPGGKLHVGHMPPDANHDVIRSTIAYAILFLTALNCTNVERVEHAPEAKLQQARERRGKHPLFSYWTLALSIPGAQRSAGVSGGTHAERRLHLCRGHIKRRKTGYFWWQPHIRGNKKAGMVHKDYAVHYAPAEGQND